MIKKKIYIFTLYMHVLGVWCSASVAITPRKMNKAPGDSCYRTGLTSPRCAAGDEAGYMLMKKNLPSD